MKDFSQQGEQAVILKYFGDQRGVALDVGANDGITLSNSRALVGLGWSAVLVEPAAPAFRKLLQNYGVTGSGRKPDDFAGTPGEYHAMISGGLVMAPGGRVTLVNAAITTRDGPIDFYDSGTHLKKGDTSLLSTTHPGEMVRWKRSGETFTRTTVRGITFATLMKETGLTRADFISIDCEGADWEITKQIDLAAVGCRMLCVEGNRSPDRQKFIDYAGRHGMKLHWTNFENLIFAIA